MHDAFLKDQKAESFFFPCGSFSVSRSFSALVLALFALFLLVLFGFNHMWLPGLCSTSLWGSTFAAQISCSRRRRLIRSWEERMNLRMLLPAPETTQTVPSHDAEVGYTKSSQDNRTLQCPRDTSTYIMMTGESSACAETLF